MLAWYSTRATEKAKLTRAGEAVSSGEAIQYPPARLAGWLISCLEDAGLYTPGMSGAYPLTATELSRWAEGTHTDLGCIDFQDILDASRAYVSARNEFDGSAFGPPWTPDMTPEEEAAMFRAQERAWDIAMGV